MSTTSAQGKPVRGGPIVRAFHVGLAALEGCSAIVVKLDAHISMGPDYFERLLAAFLDDPTLGIASGSGHEGENGQLSATGDHRNERLGSIARIPLTVPPGRSAADRILLGATQSLGHQSGRLDVRYGHVRAL